MQHPFLGFVRFIERLAMLSDSNPYSAEFPDIPLIPREPTDVEMARAKFVGLLSAVDRLSRGVTTSLITGDSYLERLQQASPEERQEALEYYNYTLADYDHWAALVTLSSGQPPFH